MARARTDADRLREGAQGARQLDGGGPPTQEALEPGYLPNFLLRTPIHAR